MAGDWIQMRCDLADDPAVIGIAAAVKLEEDYVVGKLHRLWSWADRQVCDGNAPGVTGEWIDRYLGVPGFAAAMAVAHWLTINSDSVTFPKFDRYFSQSAKQRALTARRVAKHRAQTGNDDSVTKALPEKKTVLRYGTVRTDVEKLDWQEVQRLAKSRICKVQARPTSENRLLLYAAAAMVVLGVLPEAWFVDAIDALEQRQKKRGRAVKNPMAWLTKVFARTAREQGHDFHQLRGMVTVPDYLVDGKPTGGKE